MRRLALAATCVVGATFATGCGGDGGGHTAETSAPTSTLGPSQAAVRIVSPTAGSQVRTRRDDADNLSGTLAVVGDADALQTVRVDGRCPEHPCSNVVYTGPKGRWTTHLRLALPPKTRRLTVTADYAVTGTATSAAQVTLVVHVVRSPAADQKRSPSARPSPSPGVSTPTVPSTTPTTPSPPASSDGARDLVLVGDSLAVGVRSLLPAALAGWNVRVLGRTSRPLAEGMSVLDGLSLSSTREKPVVAISLFTNDDPTHTAALESAVRHSLDVVGPRGCAIWATIARPPVNGVTYTAANRLLARIATDDPRLVIVPWAEQVAANPGLLGGDGVHATPAGYELRARLYAEAAQRCR